jgi:hypothetical protein
MDRPHINQELDLDLQLRIAGIDSYMAALEQGLSIAGAAKIYDINWYLPNHKGAEESTSRGIHYINYQLRKLFESGTLRNIADHPRPPKMADAQVREAADILAAGYSQPCINNNAGIVEEYYEQRHFTSMAQAARMSTQLQSLMEEYDVTSRYLLTRMHEVCPDLVYSALPMKLELTSAQKQARQEDAALMLARHAADPSYLRHIIWGDETRIYIGKELSGKLKVYHYRRGTDGVSPMECPHFNKANSIRLDVLLFVSPVWGGCHVEFLTGTTGIEEQGRHTTGMQEAMTRRAAGGEDVYKMS